MVVITPSTPYASGLDQCLEEFPDRTIDVGMAEQQGCRNGSRICNSEL